MINDLKKRSAIPYRLTILLIVNRRISPPEDKRRETETGDGR